MQRKKNLFSYLSLEKKKIIQNHPPHYPNPLYISFLRKKIQPQTSMIKVKKKNTKSKEKKVFKHEKDYQCNSRHFMNIKYTFLFFP